MWGHQTAGQRETAEVCHEQGWSECRGQAGYGINISKMLLPPFSQPFPSRALWFNLICHVWVLYKFSREFVSEIRLLHDWPARGRQLVAEGHRESGGRQKAGHCPGYKTHGLAVRRLRMIVLQVVDQARHLLLGLIFCDCCRKSSNALRSRGRRWKRCWKTLDWSVCRGREGPSWPEWDERTSDFHSLKTTGKHWGTCSVLKSLWICFCSSHCKQTHSPENRSN